jgi:hypothetical protein
VEDALTDRSEVRQKHALIRCSLQPNHTRASRPLVDGLTDASRAQPSVSPPTILWSLAILLEYTGLPAVVTMPRKLECISPGEQERSQAKELRERWEVVSVDILTVLMRIDAPLATSSRSEVKLSFTGISLRTIAYGIL